MWTSITHYQDRDNGEYIQGARVAMAFVVNAIWKCIEGKERVVADFLRKMTTFSAAEPGCLMYEAYQSTTDPREFFLYEKYRDEQASEEHKQTDYYKQYVLNGAVPLLTSRTPKFFRSLE